MGGQGLCRHRFVIDTGRIYGFTALQALCNALASLTIVPQAR